MTGLKHIEISVENTKGLLCHGNVAAAQICLWTSLFLFTGK